MYGTSPEMMQRMYVKGSLKNQGSGFVFQVKNLIDSGSVSGVAKLAVDGEQLALDGATIELGGKVRQVSEISWSAPIYVSYGATATFFVPGALPAGEHTLNVQLNVPELGRLSLPITDMVT
ncbi:MAG: hypothetical protein JSV36_06420 [Anaerolineae bacterium]|nr:MAG: hypothetical protein JSV36_06420 [Anaerolineae bacterium]